jgi:hypothetical protein
MKTAKSAFLASAAGLVVANLVVTGLVAMPGAQAADLPVKAKAVQYVKVCSLYGAGFYYIPGTDICMKVGGFIRWQETANPGSNISGGPLLGTGGRHTRVDSQDFAQRTRAVVTFDTRQSTAYGVLRTYLSIGFNQDSTSGPTTAPTVYMTRGFLQIAGFTFGKATSFFDFVNPAGVSYNSNAIYSPYSGDAGVVVASYTAQLGNGVSATLGAEQARRRGTVNLNASAAEFSTVTLLTACNDLGGQQGTVTSTTTCNVGLQDIVGNVRIDQTWGAALVSVAAGDRSAGYFSATPGIAAAGEAQGHPDQKWGWAASVGLRLNTPMIGRGDYFQIQGVYSEGMTGYMAQSPGAAPQNLWSGNKVAYGFWTDGVYTNAGTAGGTGGSIELTTGWNVYASYEHFWTPSLRTSVYGSYVELKHNDVAKTAMCATQTGVSSALQGGAGCNPDWSAWNVGTRSQWDITPDLYVGIDVMYAKLNSASTATGTLTTAASGGKPAGVYTVSDQDAVLATWRIHRDIVP